MGTTFIFETGTSSNGAIASRAVNAPWVLVQIVISPFSFQMAEAVWGSK